MHRLNLPGDRQRQLLHEVLQIARADLNFLRSSNPGAGEGQKDGWFSAGARSACSCTPAQNPHGSPCCPEREARTREDRTIAQFSWIALLHVEREVDHPKVDLPRGPRPHAPNSTQKHADGAIGTRMGAAQSTYSLMHRALNDDWVF